MIAQNKIDSRVRPESVGVYENNLKNKSAQPEPFGQDGEVLWQYGFHNEKYYASSYAGEHYSINLGNVDLFFNTSTDGVTWEPVDENIPVTYHGGISEVG